MCIRDSLRISAQNRSLEDKLAAEVETGQRVREELRAYKAEHPPRGQQAHVETQTEEADSGYLVGKLETELSQLAELLMHKERRLKDLGSTLATERRTREQLEATLEQMRPTASSSENAGKMSTLLLPECWDSGPQLKLCTAPTPKPKLCTALHVSKGVGEAAVSQIA
eukprot:TRINITY_DN55931_c0_g1_i1.p2 TRINITY_DN55931_c0_g1~~TRINITY_DN55931_c0_g1_i1.p2  ORF type:complete len:187 (-),score=47.64 TRINITY_DN55931_c0_g1_i1:56-559(-)